MLIPITEIRFNNRELSTVITALSVRANELKTLYDRAMNAHSIEARHIFDQYNELETIIKRLENTECSIVNV